MAGGSAIAVVVPFKTVVRLANIVFLADAPSGMAAVPAQVAIREPVVVDNAGRNTWVVGGAGVARVGSIMDPAA